MLGIPRKCLFPVGLDPACRCWEPDYTGSMVVSSPGLKAFLLETPFFGGLSDASLDLLLSMLVERHFDVGATVVAEGEPGRSMFIVHSGELVVSKLGDSDRVIRLARREARSAGASFRLTSLSFGECSKANFLVVIRW